MLLAYLIELRLCHIILRNMKILNFSNYIRTFCFLEKCACEKIIGIKTFHIQHDNRWILFYSFYFIY